MIEAWATQRPVRLFLAASTFAVGFAVAVLLLHRGNFALATAIFSITLAALVGAGKLASPWGFNAATTAVASSGRGHALKTSLYIAAYVLPASIVWAVLGIVFGFLAGIPLLVPLLACAYALLFGLFETLGLPLRAPGLAWQVPSSWINGRSLTIQTITWGTILGPGLVTRNPYAGMWLLPLLIALNHNLLIAVTIGIAIGCAHGVARALGVLNNRKYLADTTIGHLRILGLELQWRYMDGLALLLAAGALAASTFSLLIVHF